MPGVHGKMAAMEPSPPQSLDLTRMPPEAARVLLAQYEALQKRYDKPKLSTEEWLKEFDVWVKSHKPLPHIVDDSRDSIYD